MRIKSPKRFLISIITIVLTIFIIIGIGKLFSSLFPNGIIKGGRLIKNNQSENFIVAGVDKEGLRTDVILFCQYNDATKKLNLLQIPRDTKVDTKRSDKKINSAYGSKDGIETLMNEVGTITGINPEKYVIINFKAFRELIDAIGGVDVEVPFRMYYHDPVQNFTIDLLPGMQHLDGRRAEMFIRFRQNDDGSGYKNGDIERLATQQKFYQIVADKLISVKNVFKTHKILQIFNDNVKMSFTGEDIVSYIGKIPGFKRENINMFTLPGEGKYVGPVSYFINDVEATKKIIDENFKSSDNVEFLRTVKPSKNKYIKVEVVNSSSINKDILNVSKVVKEKLEEYGFNVIAAYNSDKIKDKSSIVDHNAKNGSAEILKIYNGIDVINDENPKSDADVTFYIGNDFTF